MENVYRREYVRERKNQYLGKSEKFSLKNLMTKQCVICVIILIFTLVICFSPDGEMEFEKNAVKYILTCETDFKSIPKNISGFINEYLFDKEEKKEGKDALLDMVCPLSGTLESPFGMRMHPTQNVEKFHYGIDISESLGAEIKCSQKGIAKEVSQNEEYGKYILVEHGEDIFTLYAHCSEIIAVQGDEIQKGQTIAKVGDTGNVTGPHLHFEIRDGDEWLDPAEFIDLK